MDFMGNTAPGVIFIRSFKVFLKVSFSISLMAFSLSSGRTNTVQLSGCPDVRQEIPADARINRQVLAFFFREIDKKFDQFQPGTSTIQELLQQFPLTVYNLNQNHGVQSQAVMVFRRDVIRTADTDIARSFFNGVPKLFIIRTCFFHGVGDNVKCIPGIAGMGIDGKLLVIVENVRIQPNKFLDDLCF